MNATHIIKSEYLIHGLFGQLFSWCLEVLPYLEKHGIKPEWHLLSRNYGKPPGFNIFPEILRINYLPTEHMEASEILSLEDLKHREGHPSYSFQSDFALANRLFNRYFRLPDEVINAVEAFFLTYPGQRILGLHYRGTDKPGSTIETNPITTDLTLRAACDLLEKKGDIDLVFVASDEESFLARASKALPVPVISFQQRRKANRPKDISETTFNEPLFRGHEEAENTRIGQCALIDSLLLSRCHYLLKSQSALSGWSKIWNPQLEAYRLAAFKQDWFPDAFIPLYKTDNSELNAELMTVQDGEISLLQKLKSSLPVSEYLTK